MVQYGPKRAFPYQNSRTGNQKQAICKKRLSNITQYIDNKGLTLKKHSADFRKIHTRNSENPHIWACRAAFMKLDLL